MKWIIKIVSGLIIVSLVVFKILSPKQTLLAEIVTGVVLVVFFLGLGEQLIIQSWVALEGLIGKPARFNNKKWSIQGVKRFKNFGLILKSFTGVLAKR